MEDLRIILHLGVIKKKGSIYFYKNGNRWYFEKDEKKENE